MKVVSSYKMTDRSSSMYVSTLFTSHVPLHHSRTWLRHVLPKQNIPEITPTKPSPNPKEYRLSMNYNIKESFRLLHNLSMASSSWLCLYHKNFSPIQT